MKELGLSREQFINLGRENMGTYELFSMSMMALVPVPTIVRDPHARAVAEGIAPTASTTSPADSSFSISGFRIPELSLPCT